MLTASDTTEIVKCTLRFSISFHSVQLSLPFSKTEYFLPTCHLPC